MHIREILKKNETSLSFEFFPPKNEKMAIKLFNTINDLTKLNPSFVSVTYGAGGTTRELTHELLVNLKKESHHTIVSHLTCVGSTKDEIMKILEIYNQSGINNIMALRGDPPQGESSYQLIQGGFEYAVDLVRFIKSKFPEMGIGVAGFPEGHPGTPNRLKEIEYLKEKVDAGADYICTQLFFDNRDFFDFCERCELSGINIPIIAGIMPVTSASNMKKMAELAMGARFPAKLLRALARASDRKQFSNIGIHWSTQQVLDLVDKGVKGIHFYTLNKSKATMKIYDALGLRPE